MNWLLLLLIALAPDSGDKPVGKLLVYEIDRGSGIEDKSVEPVIRNTVVMLDHRINPPGRKRARIRSLGQGRIEIAVYDDDPKMLRRIERLAEAAGTLEFRILANDRDHASLIEQATQLKATQRELKDSQGIRLAWWVPAAPGREEAFKDHEEIATRKKKQDAQERLEILVVKDPYHVTGQYLVQAKVGEDHAGRPCIHFTFNRFGGRLFGGLTSENLPDEEGGRFTRKLGIILDGDLHSAPAIRGTISERGEITGDFTKEEVQDLVDVLNSGALPVLLRKVEPDGAEEPR